MASLRQHFARTSRRRQRLHDGARLRVESLEPRVLFSAEHAALAPDDALTAGLELRQPESVSTLVEVDLRLGVAGGPTGPDFATPEDDSARHGRELVIIDSRVPDPEALIASLENTLSDRQFDILLIDATDSGLGQISAFIDGHEPWAAWHAPHASPGSLELGTDTLSNHNIAEHTPRLAAWANALTDSADILLYGCDLAASDEGLAFIGTLAELTGADIAASNDTTGEASLGGDFTLEAHSGSIEATIALDAQAQARFTGTLATYTVTNTNATGAGSLRQAITDANLNSGTDTIQFSIAGAGPHTITPTSALPIISEAVIIDGTSEPDYAGTPVIELDGSGAGAGARGLELSATAAGSTIRGLIIHNFSSHGIGINVGADGNTIAGNWIGLDADGNTVAANDGNGINIESAGNTLGGTDPGDRNVIAGNLGNGVRLTGSDNLVIGNYVGTNAAGTAGVGNGVAGVQIEGGSNNRIGGTLDAERNVISGNTGIGIQINGATIDGTVIQKNFIGTNASGTAAISNGAFGVSVDGSATNTLIGGAGSGNLISGNTGSGGSGARGGIYLASFDTTIQGNTIGYDITGTTPIANGQAISASAGIYAFANSTATIGGTLAGEGNLIAGNTGKGIATATGFSPTITILGNEIHGNTGAAIDLNNDGLNANDPGDPDVGPNALQNSPVLDSAFTNAAGMLVVSGSLNSQAYTSYRVEFFANPGGGQNTEQYLGFRDVITDANGNADFLQAFAETIGLGVQISATATSLATGASSEVSGTTATASALVVDTTTDVIDGNTGSIANLLSNRGADGFISLREAIIATNNTGGHDGIYLPAGTYLLTRAGGGEEFASTGDLDIRDSLSIFGAGAGSTIIDGNALDGVIDLTVAAGDLRITDVTVTGGAVNDQGGGFYVEAGAHLVIADAVIANNDSINGSWGGGIASYGSVSIDAVRITGNDSSNTGGGVANWTGTMFVTHSLIDANTSVSDGAGIWSAGAGSMLTVINSTISGNLSGGLSGGIYTEDAYVAFSTIAGNTATSTGGGVVKNGGSTVTLNSNIIADNLAPSSPDINGLYTSQGYNVIGDSNGSGGWNGNDQQNTDPLLGSLTDNGGPTLTHAIFAGSPAQNTADPGTSVATDQRGVARNDGSPDAGAFDTANSVSTLTVDTTADTLDGDTSSIAALLGNRGGDGRISLREAITATNNTANGGGPDRIHFSIPDALFNGAHTITPASALPTITGAVVIDASTEPDFGGTPVVVIDGNNLVAAGLTLSSTADGSTIRGLIIRDFQGDGILIASGSDGNLIAGNYLGGLDVTGASAGAAEANTESGLNVAGSNNTIGGTPVADRNVFSNNDTDGLRIGGSTGNVVQGNIIGLDAGGTVSIGNGVDGIRMLNAADGNTIGGTVAGAGNVISASSTYGILVWGSDNNVFQGNLIGTDITGTVSHPNHVTGIDISDTSTGNLVGGTAPGAGNTIQFNGISSGFGIQVRGTATDNAILGNSIDGSFGLGINLDTDNVTANDAGDADSGPNTLQNYPVLFTATSGAGDTTITGSLNSAANTDFRIEYFSSPVADGTGHGEAATYLGFDTVTTDGSGNASINSTLSGVTVTAGDIVTSTATVDQGAGTYTSTSEFSLNVIATAANQIPVIGFGEGDKAYTENGAAIILDALATVTDDSADFDGGHLLVDFTANGQSGDRIQIRNQGMLAGQVGIIGSDVYYGGVQIGTFSGSGAPMDVSFNASADVAAVQAVIRNVTFHNLDEDPSTANRSIRFRLSDGDGGDAVAQTKTVIVSGDSDLWVTTTSDTADGNVLSVQTLLADRGADGRISLREAITVANNTAGINQIYFNIPDALVGGAHSIALSTALPQITDAVTIDGSTEPDFASTPIVELNGTDAGAAHGLVLSAGSDGSTVTGLVINRFSLNGITILDTTDVTISGNYVGTNVSGTVDLGNGGTGIQIGNITGSIQIGELGAGNLISGNDAAGIEIAGASASANTILGNRIGTNAAGTAALGNANAGIALVAGANGNIIGGTSAAAANLISGNTSGIDINGAGTSNNQVIGNRIGTDAAGTAAIANSNVAITLYNSAHNNIIGGASAAHRNILAGASIDGIRISDVDGTQILNNYIGTDITGTVDLGFAQEGVEIQSGTGTVVGAAGSGNLISGNGFAGISIQGGSAHIVQGNRIGTDAAGLADLGNTGGGILISGGASTNQIGGGGAGEGNLVSGNDSFGIRITGAGSNDNRIENNAIGLNASSSAALANSDDGIRVDGAGAITGTVIGGTTTGLGNTISGNAGDGVEIRDGATSVLVAGNTIGLAADGVTVFGNLENGIRILESDNNIVGGSVAQARNIISGNGSAGLRIDGAGATGNSIFGNYIGTTATGLAAAGNVLEGIKITGAASSNQIGTDLAGAGNLISGNLNDGLAISNASNNIIENNWIGVDASGNVALGNGDDGVQIGVSGAAGNIVGGASALSRNIISGNGDDGLQIYDTAIDTTVQGNYIGVGADGVTAIANASNGIVIYGAAVNSLIGGTGAGEGNLIAHHSSDGVQVIDPGTTGHSFLGNRIFGNAGLGLDLANDGVDINDAGDPDAGPNDHQNHPVLFTSDTSGGNTQITGSLNSAASTNYRIEFFSSATADGTGHGEAETYLGDTSVTTDGSGNASINVSLIGVSVTAGHAVTAMATVDEGGGNYGSSSEFAMNVIATASNAAPVIAFGSGDFAVPENGVIYIIDGTATATDGDSADFDAGHLIVDFSANGAPEDRVFVVHQGTGAGQIGVSGSNISYAGITIGSFVGGTDGSTPLDITLNGAADIVAVQALMRRIGYQVLGEDPSTLTRSIRFTLSDGDGGTSTPIVKNISITADSDLWVTTTADTADGDTSSVQALLTDRGADGRISLREAITATNNSIGTNQIYFSIPDALVGGAHTIQPTTPLPSITDPVDLDATTDPDFAGTPIIELDGSLVGAGGDGLLLTAGSDGSQIRGLVINRFTDDGIDVSGADNVAIHGNLLGVDVSGTSPLANGVRGVYVHGGSTGTVIGSGAAADRNIVAGNSSHGIVISGATNTTIQGNRIGTDLTGTLSLGNIGAGIKLGAGAADTLIGGENAGERNIIAFNQNDGIKVSDATTQRNSFVANIIHDNTGREIDLNDDGLTNNDGNDLDTGPNDLQNFPVLTDAVANGANLLLSGTLDTDKASTDFRIDFYGIAAGGQEVNDHGGGNIHLGSTQITTTPAGDGSFTSVSIANGGLIAGDLVSAIATVIENPGQVGLDALAAYGESSEFAANVAITPSSPPVIGFGEGDKTFSENGAAIFIDTSATATDSDSADFDTGHLVVEFTANGQPEDRLTIVHEGNGAGQIGVSAATISFGGTTIGTFVGGTDGSTPLDITFNASADASATQALMRRIAYQAIGEDPSTLTRTLRFSLSDGDGGIATPITKNVTVAADADIWVSTTSDTSDGDTSSISALQSNKGADGRVSLREAITAANNSAGANQIHFDIPDALTGGAHTIQPLSALPGLTDTVIIDASTEPDFAGTPIVEIDGSLAGLASGLSLNSLADGTTIRGLVVNRFQGTAILIASGADNVTIAGNYIGTDVTGTLDAGSTSNGINVNNVDSLMIGGSSPADRNLISGNDVRQIEINSGATNATIHGNYIGTDASGRAAVGGGLGILLFATSATQIGGPLAGQANVISGLDSGGISLAGGADASIRGNFIGTNAFADNLGNGGAGLVILGAGTQASVGGTVPGEGNTIAFNTSAGVRVDDTGNQHPILGNLIYANGALAIDLASNGITPNDLDDIDAGANGLLNFPVLSAAFAGATTYVSGAYQGLASTDLRLEFFASALPDPAGHGEAERYLGSATISTDASGNASFSLLPLAGATVAGEVISATATIDLGGGNFGATSEFAANVPTTDPAPELNLDPDNSAGAGGGDFLASFTENGAPVAIADADASLIDPDSPNLSSLTVTITNLLDGASEQLAANTGGTGISAAYNSGTGVLTLSGSDSLANYQQVLRSVTYANSSENPGTTARVISFVASDGGFDSTARNASVTVNAVADAPVLAAIEAAPLAVTENDPATAISATITVADVDSTHLTSAAVAISANYVNGEDLLAFADTANITGSWNAATGVLNLAGVDTVAAYQAALRSITYQNLSDDPSTLTRTLSIAVSDDTQPSNIPTRDITITAVDDPPSLTISGTGDAIPGVAYTVNLSATDPDGVAITAWTINWGDGNIETLVGNPATATHTYDLALAGHSLNVSASATDPNGVHFASSLFVPSWSGTDLVHVYDGAIGDFAFTMAPITDGLDNHIEVIQGPNGHLFVSSELGDSVVEYLTDGTLVGTFVTAGSGGLNGSAGMAFGADGHLYVASYGGSEVLRYDGSTGAFIDVFVASGTGGLATPLGLNFGPDGMLYVSSRGANNLLRFDPVTGAPDASFNGNMNGGVPEDFVFAPNGEILAADIGGNVMRIDATTGASLGAFIAFGTGGLSSVAGLAFGPDGHLYVADQGADTIRKYDGQTGLYLGDHVPAGTGGLVQPAYISFEADHQVQVRADVEPVVNLDADASSGAGAGNFLTSYTEDTAPVLIADVDATVADPDSANLESLTVIISNQLDGIDETLSANTAGTSIIAAYTSATGTLSLSGTDTVANYQQVLRTVSYVNASQNPTTTDRIISFTASDGTFTSASVNATVVINASNDAPTLAGIEGSPLAYTENDPDTPITTTLVVSDADSANLASATVSITANYVDGEDVLSFVDTASIAGTWNAATGLLTLTGSDSVANYQAALRSVTYRNTSEDPALPTRTVSISVNDGSLASNILTRDINITTVNDEQVLTVNRGLSVVIGSSGNVIASIDLQTTDVDNTASELTYTVDALPGNGVVKLNGTALNVSDTFTQSDIDSSLLSFDHVAGSFGTLAFTVDDGTGTSTSDVFLLTTGIQNDAYTTDEDTPIIIDPTTNDAGPNGEAVTVVEFTQPANGGVIDNGNGTLTYTPAAEFSGADSFAYVGTDAGAGLAHYYAFEGDAADRVGAADGTLTGTSTVSGSFGQGLLFNETADYASLPDIVYQTAFSISFDFKIDNNAGSLFKYLYSHGDINGTDSVNIFINENAHGTDPSVMRTVVRDSDDTLDNLALQFDISSLEGDGQWHNYVLTADASGLKVYLDGSLMASDPSRGTAGVDPVLAAIVGARHDLDASRMYGGSLDSLQVFDTALSANRVSSLGAMSNAATVNLTVNALNDAPSLNAIEATPLAYIENDPASVISSTITVSDVDSPNLTSAAVAISANYVNGEDLLAFADTANITGSWNAATGVLTLTGVDTVAAYQAALRSVTYLNTSDDPSALTRTVSFSVNDGAGSNSASNTLTRDITIAPVNDAPVISSDGAGPTASLSGPENNTSVTTVTSTDPDSPPPTYTIVGGDDAALFSIDPNTGVVSFLSAPDFEAPADLNADNIYLLTVAADDGAGGLDTQDIDFSVSNVNEGPVSPVTDADGSANAIAEGSPNGSTVGITASASEPDFTTDLVSYSLDDDAGGRFAIDPLTGIVTVANTALIDFETSVAHNITVRATSSDGSASTALYTVAVIDINDTPPSVDSASLLVPEFSPLGAPVGLLTASDPDTLGSLQNWTITGGSGATVFAIDPATGLISVADPAALDILLNPAFDLDVTVSDGLNTSAPRNITITVTNVEEPPCSRP
ncbi:MAG: DUF4347 domain-containing protein [Burkholderiaceae bacterium]